MNTKLFCRLTSCLTVLISTLAVAAEPVVVAHGSGGHAPKQPQAAVAADGVVHLVYGVGESVYHTSSTDGGETFAPPREAFRVANLSLGMRRGPRIAVVGKSVVVTAIGGQRGKGKDGDLQAWRSSDGGTSWHGPVKVNDAADSAREGLHGMAAGADDSIWCVWLDLRDKKSEVYAAKSTDDGATWSSNVLVYRSPDGAVCPCCHPSVLVSEGAVHVLFRNALAGNRDMYVSTSRDGGATFQPAKKLGQGAWKLDACPMDGGMLAQGAKGELVTVWRRGGEIFTASSSGGKSSTGGKEFLLGRGEQPWVTSSANGPVVVWTAGREGDLWLQSAGGRQPQKLAGSARDPMVTAAVGGKGPVIACWESKRDGQSVVLAARIDGR